MDQFLESYCNSSLWESNFTALPHPVFTDCFQHVVLVWAPCGFLFLLSPLFFYSNSQSKHSPLKWSTLHTLKLVLSLFLLASTCSQLIYRLTQQYNGVQLTTASFVSPFIIAVTSILAIAMQEYQRCKGQVTSGILFQFWLLLLLCGVITCSDRIREAINNKHRGESIATFEFVVFFCYYAFLTVIVVLHCFAEPAPTQKEGNSPEATSSFLNKLFFWWFNPIILLGYRKPLTADDTWNLEEQDRAAQVGRTFRQLWEDELRKCRESAGMVDPDKNYTTKGFLIEEKVKDYNTGDKKFDYTTSRYRPSIWKAMFKQYWKTLLVIILLKLFNDSIQFLKPALLSAMIAFTENSSAPSYQGYFIAVAMYVVTILQAIFLQQYFIRCSVIGMQIRTSLITVIYDKALKISNSAKQESTLGEIVNLMSTDAQRLMDLMTFINILWSGPFQIVVSIILLYRHLQYAVFAGVVVMVIAVPLNTYVLKKMRRYSAENMKNKDERMKMMSEVLNGIKVLKMYGWEPSFEDQIKKIRDRELRVLRKIAMMKSLSFLLWNLTPFVVTLVSFGVYLTLSPDNVLDATKTFVSISLFNIIRFPITKLPNVLTSLIQAQVSVKRMTKFLISSEIDLDRNQDEDDQKAGEDQVSIKDASFKWDYEGDNILHDIHMHVKPGELVAIVGHVGSGKSSLVSAMLGEMEKVKGSVNVKGTVAYVPQQAWIQNATVKENILFGKMTKEDMAVSTDANMITSFTTKDNRDYDVIVSNQLYEKTLESTALKSDLTILPAGDQTEIGEKGINLSGGQKQRISLARAIIQQADVYLLDDPLSAVDSHIGKHIFENVIGPTGMLKDKTRILVTHGVRSLPKTDRIIVLDHGRISESGTYQELLKRNGQFSKFLEEYATSQHEESSENSETISHTDEPNQVDKLKQLEDLEFNIPNDIEDTNELDELIISAEKIRNNRRDSIQSKTSRYSTTSGSSILSRMSSKKLKQKLLSNFDEDKKDKGKLTGEEVSAKGAVKWSVFARYFKAVGTMMCAVILTTETLYNL